jgi:GNAT superfamily N-acetyltransferase
MLTIRTATKEDAKLVHGLIVELSIFEKEPDAVTNSVEQFTIDGFETSPPLFYVFIAELGDVVVGYSLFFFSYSTWVGKCLYLDDLYIKPEFRVKGYGRTVLQAVVKHAMENKCKRVTWQALDWNMNARNFYNKISREMSDPLWITYQMQGKMMNKFLNLE